MKKNGSDGNRNDGKRRYGYKPERSRIRGQAGAAIASKRRGKQDRAFLLDRIQQAQSLAQQFYYNAKTAFVIKVVL